MRRRLEPGLPQARMIDFDFHAPSVAGLPFDTQNVNACRIDRELQGRSIQMIRDRQAISYRLTTVLHRVSVPADECYRQRPRFVYVALPIGVIGQDFHDDTFGVKPNSRFNGLGRIRTIPFKPNELSRSSIHRNFLLNDNDGRPDADIARNEAVSQ